MPPITKLLAAAVLAIFILTGCRMALAGVNGQSGVSWAGFGSIAVPARIKPSDARVSSEDPNRAEFRFDNSYVWASWGSNTAYRHMMSVSLFAADAPTSAYGDTPEFFGYNLTASYKHRKTVLREKQGSAELEVIDGIYARNTLEKPGRIFIYTDRSKRLQVAWHCVKEEYSLEEALRLLPKVAQSFEISRDTADYFAEIRDRPRKEALDKQRRHALALDNLEKFGFPRLKPGESAENDGVLVEYTVDPEPRLQFLKVLGKVKPKRNLEGWQRPRPAHIRNEDGSPRWPVTVGWWECKDGEWEFLNHSDGYLPFPRISKVLSHEYRDPSWIAFYASYSIRIEETADVSPEPFLKSLPEIERYFREGKLIHGEMQ